ncbi:hypothetical protein RB195_018145 [Necator americanus]|uniref:Phlebovirus glycoprotein G2 fusion domain-containing protein n=1 Tax=Necator americanus TaxID=51031 RepID=A0ABR1CA07_NECAM
MLVSFVNRERHLAIAMVSLPSLCLLLRTNGWIVKLFCRILTTFGPIRWCISHARQWGNPTLKTYISRRKQKHVRKLITCTIVMLQIAVIGACSQFTSIAADENVCTIVNNTEACVFNEVTTMMLQLMQQETCLALRDHKNDYIGVISIKLNGIQYQREKG